MLCSYSMRRLFQIKLIIIWYLEDKKIVLEKVKQIVSLKYYVLKNLGTVFCNFFTHFSNYTTEYR